MVTDPDSFDLMKLLRPLILILPFLLAACSDSNDNSSSAEDRPQLGLNFSEAPIDLPGIAANCSLDVRYGEAERNLLDICMPESDEPTPLVIYFHGGAYYVGDKSSVYNDFPNDIRDFLQSGIAFATINYPFINIDPPYDDEGVIKPLTHSARALQFLRYHAESLNIDAEQVASYGVSAGASTSLWLGTHDDLAKPGNPDPVLRESTRLKAAAALHTQGTLNFISWEEILAPVVGNFFEETSIPVVAVELGAAPLLFGATGTDTVEELETPEMIAYLENIDFDRQYGCI